MSTTQLPITNYQLPSRWPIAAAFRGSAINLNAVIESEFTGAQLRELAKWLGVTPKGNSRVGLIDQVVTALAERSAKLAESPDALFEGLTPEQQDFARRLLTARDYQMPIPRATAAAVWGRVVDARRLTEMIESLRRRALLFPTHAYYPSSFRDVYYQWLPLNGHVPVMKWEVRSEKLKVKSDGAVANSSPVTSNFLEDFDAFLGAVLQNGITLRAPLPAHKQAARLAWLRDWEHDADEAERVLRSRPNWVPDPGSGISVPLLSPFTPSVAAALENQTGLMAAQCAFHFAIACALQLIQAPDPATHTGQSPLPAHVRVRTSAVEEWLVLANEQKLRRAWKAWSEEITPVLEARSAMASLKAGETFRVMRAIGARDLTPALFAAEWCALRRYVTRVLRGLPVGQWVSWPELAEHLFDFYPECIWTFSTRAEWWFAPAGSTAKLNMSRADEWRNSAGQIIGHIISDSLAWFGAVETRTNDGALDAFRITDLGAALIGGHEGALPTIASPGERRVEPIVWLDKHILRVPPAPDRAAFISLIRQVSERGAEPFTFLFTTASIERALAAGIALDDVTAQFKQVKVALPKALADQFRLIARRYGRIRVYQQLTVLELADDFAARELAASTSLLKHTIYQLSPRAFALPDDAVDALIEEMQEKGYTPRVK
jgi:hypothetical protein